MLNKKKIFVYCIFLHAKYFILIRGILIKCKIKLTMASTSKEAEAFQRSDKRASKRKRSKREKDEMVLFFLVNAKIYVFNFLRNGLILPFEIFN